MYFYYFILYIKWFLPEYAFLTCIVNLFVLNGGDGPW
jgi:hypothetical protein